MCPASQHCAPQVRILPWALCESECEIASADDGRTATGAFGQVAIDVERVRRWPVAGVIIAVGLRPNRLRLVRQFEDAIDGRSKGRCSAN